MSRSIERKVLVKDDYGAESFGAGSSLRVANRRLIMGNLADANLANAQWCLWSQDKWRPRDGNPSASALSHHLMLTQWSFNVYHVKNRRPSADQGIYAPLGQFLRQFTSRQ